MLKNRGYSPCQSIDMILQYNDTCFPVLLMPYVFYHSPEEFDALTSHCLHRKALSALAISTLLGLGIACTATGPTSLITSHQGLLKLRVEFDQYLSKFEVSMHYLQQSLSSLAGVVKENRRGLDLLFLQQGGLCKALKEECCFYVDRSGKVIQQLDDIKRGLEDNRKLNEESWYAQ